MLDERAIDFVWRFAPDECRTLLLRLASRELFKRVFELRVGELRGGGDYSALKDDFQSADRADRAKQLQEKLLNKVDSQMREQERTPTSTIADNIARRHWADIDTRGRAGEILVVVDFPVRGLPDDQNLPDEIGDWYRKYFTLPPQETLTDTNVFYEMRRLQMKMASLRIFAAPEFHELIIRYLNPPDIRACVLEVFPKWT